LEAAEGEREGDEGAALLEQEQGEAPPVGLGAAADGHRDRAPDLGGAQPGRALDLVDLAEELDAVTLLKAPLLAGDLALPGLTLWLVEVPASAAGDHGGAVGAAEGEFFAAELTVQGHRAAILAGAAGAGGDVGQAGAVLAAQGASAVLRPELHHTLEPLGAGQREARVDGDPLPAPMHPPPG
jgi:hypothetical protein